MSGVSPKKNIVIDFAKGYTIFLVVLAHAIVPAIRGASGVAAIIYTFIYSFHMFAFFFFSGYLFQVNSAKYNNFGRFAGNKALKLMVPYLSLSVFAYALNYVLTHIGALSKIAEVGGFERIGLKETIIGILTWHNHIDAHLWYIYVLFIIFILNVILRKLNPKYTLLIALGLSAAVALINFHGQSDSVITRTAIYNVAFCFGRCYIGFDAPERKKSSSVLLSLVSFAVIGAYVATVYIQHKQSKSGDIFALTNINVINIFIKYIIGVFGTILIISISRLTVFLPKWQKITLLFNKYCYEIYLFHQPFIVAGCALVIFKMLHMNWIIASLCACAIGIAVPILLSAFIIRKVPIFNLLLCGVKMKKKSKETVK